MTLAEWLFLLGGVVIGFGLAVGLFGLAVAIGATKLNREAEEAEAEPAHGSSLARA